MFEFENYDTDIVGITWDTIETKLFSEFPHSFINVMYSVVGNFRNRLFPGCHQYLHGLYLYLIIYSMSFRLVEK